MQHQPVVATADAQGVHAELTVTGPAGWTTGAPLNATLLVSLPKGARLEPPALGTTLGAWDVRGQHVLLNAPPGTTGVGFTLTAWEPGELEIPAIPLSVVLADGTRAELKVGPAKATLDSLLQSQVALTELPAPLRGPVDIATGNWLWFVVALLGAVTCIWLASWMFRRGRHGHDEEVLPADAWALREMDRLESERLPGRGQVDHFFARLSDIVRHYVEQRWGISAPEQTTKEFLRTAATHPELAGGHERTLGGFLRAADMVKFAAVRPGNDACGQALDSMRGFVRATAPVEEPAANEPPAPQPPAPKPPVAHPPVSTHPPEARS